MVYKKEKKKRD